MVGATHRMLPSAELSRLRWRCRRGIRELDLLLTAWLDTVGPAAGSERMGQFARLLELPDPEIERYLLGGVRPDDPGTAGIVAGIRELRLVNYVQQTANLCEGGPV